MKTPVLILMFLYCGAMVVHSQTPQWAWAKKISAGITGEASCRDVICDAAGNVYITGTFYGVVTFDTISLTAQGPSYIFLAKYDVNGNVAWAIDAGGKNGNVAYGLCMDNSNLLVYGYYTDTAIFGTQYLPGDSISKMFIAWFDTTNGQCLRVVQIGTMYNFSGGTGPNEIERVFIDADGNYFLQGNADSYIDFGGQGLTGSFIVKYDSLFNLIWLTNAFSGCGGGQSCIDSSGNFYMDGIVQECSYDNNIFSVDSGQNYNGYITELGEAGGTVQWLKKETGPSVSMYLLTGKNGRGLYAGGIFSGTCNLDDSTLLDDSITNQAFFICSKDYSGNTKWTEEWNIASLGDLSLTDEAGGNVALTVFAKSTDSASYITLMDSTGVVLWTKADSGTYNTEGGYPLCSVFDPAGNLIIAGTVTGQVVLDTFVISGQQSMFVAKLGNNTISSVQEIARVNAAVNIFPNPNNGNFNITGSFFSKGKTCDITVSDITGRTIAAYAVIANQGIYKVNGQFMPGCYLLNLVENAHTIATAKFVVMK